MSDGTQNIESGADFMIGDWQVLPRQNRLVHGDTTEELEARTMDVLVYLAAHAGDVVSNDELINAVWDGRPMGENPVYKCVANLRKVFGDDPKAPTVIETIPRRGYRLLLPVESTVSVQKPAALRWVAVAAVVLASIAVAVWWSNIPTTTEEGAPISIVVLPFEYLSDDSDRAFIATGIAEDILNQLARTPDLRVVARSSSFSRGAQVEDLRAFMRSLDATYVLSGSVQVLEDRLRVRARLADTEGSVIWSENFDRRSSDIFDVQNAIAASVVRGLPLANRADTPSEYSGTDNFAAYAAYARGRQSMNRRVGAWRTMAVDAFREAVALDPAFSKAHAGLATALIINTTRANADLDEARAAIDAALALDPNSAEAYAAAGLLAADNPDEASQREALTLFQQALSLNPSYNDARNWLAIVYRSMGETNQSLAVRQESLTLDPLSSLLNMNYARELHSLGRIDEAREYMKFAIDLPDSQPWELFWLADIERSIGDMAGAIAWLRQANGEGRFKDDSLRWYAGQVAQFYSFAGLHDRAEAWTDASRVSVDTVWWIIAQWRTLAPQGRLDELEERIQTHLATQPPNAELTLITRSIVGWHAERSGQHARAIEYLEPVFGPDWAIMNAPGGRGEQIMTAQVLASSYLAMDRPEDAERLLRRALDIQNIMRDANEVLMGEQLFKEAVTYLLLGELQTAEARLQSAVEVGWRDYYVYNGSSVMATLLDELPNGPALMEVVQADLAEQRARIETEDREANFYPPE